MTNMQLKGDYIGGRWLLPARADETIHKKCPADLTVTLWDAKVSYDHIESAIAAAVTGFETWRKTSQEDRIKCLKKYQEIIRTKKNEIAEALALEVGKPF
jgi:acyl-CoA reductase-like NAD-dependent aldehyde dehydrogenase